jgi:hypothetical protein
MPFVPAGQPTPEPTQQTESQKTAATQEKWREVLPEDFRNKPIEEIASTFTKVHKDFGKLHQDLGTLRQQGQESAAYKQQAEAAQANAKQWADWWGQFEPQYKNWEASQKSGSQHRQTPNQPADGGNDPFAGWEDLTPQQQAQRLSQAAQEPLRTQSQEQWTQWQTAQDKRWQEMQAGIANNVNFVKNYLQVWGRAQDAKSKNPNLDVDKMVAEGLKMAQGQIDPLDYGMRVAMAEEDKKSFADGLRKQWEEEQKAAQGKNNLTVPPGGGSVPVYRLPAKGSNGVAGQKETAARALSEKFGTGIF